MDHIFFLPIDEMAVTLEDIIAAVQIHHAETPIDGLIIDPWNELDTTRGEGVTETEFIGQKLSKMRKFSRSINIITWIVAHPAKLQKQKIGNELEYPIPTLYDISGSANWYNKTDNGLVVWRDFANDTTKILVQKVKFKQYGRHGEVVLRYEHGSGRYFSGNDNINTLPYTPKGAANNG